MRVKMLFVCIFAGLLILYTIYVAMNREHFEEQHVASLGDRVSKLEKELGDFKHKAQVQTGQADAAVMALQAIN